MTTMNPERLMADLYHLRSIGRHGIGVARPAFSPADMEARRWLLGRMEEAGLDASMDGVGNVIGHSRNPGTALLVGSHTDSQPTGGWLDGALGVVYALEAARVMAADSETSAFALDVVSWSDEEGTFMGTMGSKSFCEELIDSDVERALNLRTGQSLLEALKEAGLENLPLARLDPIRHIAYLEAHVEQGPYLEAEKKLLGVVTAIVGIRTFTIKFSGEQNHAGTTPMSCRKDAGMTLIKTAGLLDQELAKLAGPRSVWTVGRVVFEPGVPSVIPGKAELSLQFRDTDEAVLDRMRKGAERVVMEVNRMGPVTASIEPAFPEVAPAVMDEGIRRRLEEAAENHAPGAWNVMPSGAGHDAQVLARHIPAGMLFIPSIGGISHDIAEDTSEEDIIRGCRAFVEAARGVLEEVQSR
ncbi:MAG TPA: hydantoinase/carbamoylase family amidase [Desulfobacteraceae bacterium]|nr:hydantoinase/carbamoylase family amidase [Desulfobacteraceae bacterium]